MAGGLADFSLHPVRVYHGRQIPSADSKATGPAFCPVSTLRSFKRLLRRPLPFAARPGNLNLWAGNLHLRPAVPVQAAAQTEIPLSGSLQVHRCNR